VNRQLAVRNKHPLLVSLHKQKQYLISVAVFGSKVLSFKIKEHEGKTEDAN
jgi:hypothetical protein